MKVHVITLLLSCALAVCADLHTRTHIGWKASTSPDLAGYFLYYGPEPQGYTNRLTISADATNATVPSMAGRTFYAVTAFNSNGVQSLLSNEVSTTNRLRVTLALQEAGVLGGPWDLVTNQVWVGNGGSNQFFRGRLQIERIDP